MSGLFGIRRFIESEKGDGAGGGRGFNNADIPANGEHFMSQIRYYLPLYEVWRPKMSHANHPRVGGVLHRRRTFQSTSCSRRP